MSGTSIGEKLKGKFISDDGLANLAQYKYSGEDLSIIYNHIINPLAKALCQPLPKTISANVLTLGGLLCSVGAYFLLAAYTPMLTEAAPRWVYFVTAMFVFVYLMLDAMDGTQARRTNMASPIGELFDHLCDSCSLSLCTLVFAAMARMGPILGFVALMIFFIPFYSSHWDDYNTGKLQMGKFGGPTDLLVSLTIALLVTGSAGSDFWVHHVMHIRSFDVRVNHIVVAAIGLGAIVSVSQYVSHCVSEFQKVPERNRKWGKLFAEFFAFGFFLTVSIVWVVFDPAVLTRYPHRFPLAIGFINAYLLARIIVQRVTKEPVQAVHTIFGVLLACAITATVLTRTHGGRATANFWPVHILLASASATWLFFFYSAVRQLSLNMKLPVFTVLPERLEQADKATENTALLHSQDARRSNSGHVQDDTGLPGGSHV